MTARPTAPSPEPSVRDRRYLSDLIRSFVRREHELHAQGGRRKGSEEGRRYLPGDDGWALDRWTAALAPELRTTLDPLPASVVEYALRTLVIEDVLEVVPGIQTGDARRWRFTGGR